MNEKPWGIITETIIFSIIFLFLCFGVKCCIEKCCIEERTRRIAVQAQDAGVDAQNTDASTCGQNFPLSFGNPVAEKSEKNDGVENSGLKEKRWSDEDIIKGTLLLWFLL